MSLPIYSDMEFFGSNIITKSTLKIDAPDNYMIFSGGVNKEIKIVSNNGIQLQYWDKENDVPFRYIAFDHNGFQVTDYETLTRAKLLNAELKLQYSQDEKYFTVLNTTGLIFGNSKDGDINNIKINIEHDSNTLIITSDTDESASVMIHPTKITTSSLGVNTITKRSAFYDTNISLEASLIPDNNPRDLGSTDNKFNTIYCNKLYTDSIQFTTTYEKGYYSVWSGNSIQEIVQNDQFNEQGYRECYLYKMTFGNKTIYSGFIRLYATEDQEGKLFNGDEGWIHIKLPGWTQYSSFMSDSSTVAPEPNVTRTCIATACRIKTYNELGLVMTWSANEDLYIGVGTSVAPLLGISFLLIKNKQS